MSAAKQAFLSRPGNNAGWISLRVIAWPMIAALLLRAGLMLIAVLRTGTQIMTQGDTQSYLTPGRNLLIHGAFTNNGLLEIDRTPGYPLFAELSGMLFANVLSTVCVQIALSLISIWAAASIAERLFRDRRAAIVAAWLLACEPLSIVAVNRVMPETLFVTLLLLCLERLLRFLSDSKTAFLLLSAFLLVLATFVRPVSYYLAVPLAIGIAVSVPRRAGLRWKAPIVFLIVVAPCLAGWQLRNFLEIGYSGFSDIVEKNLYFYQSAEIRAELDHLSLGEEQRKLGYPDDTSYLLAHPEQRAWSRMQRLRFMKAEATSVLRQHPFMYLRSHFAGVAVVMFSPGATELLQLVGAYPSADDMPQRLVNEGVQSSIEEVAQRHPGIAAIMALFSGFAAFLYLAAVASLFSQETNKTLWWLLAGTALYFLLISGGAQAVARYRQPAIPEVCILASGGICALYDKIKRSRLSGSAQVVASVI